MAAVARQLGGVTRIMAVRAAILFTRRGPTIASRMRALLVFGHVSSFLIDAHDSGDARLITSSLHGASRPRR